MNGNINAEAARPRPLSGGIWTLFSWLRRDDHSLSSESLSSAGSDRTVVSFAFLEPLKYKAAIEPIVLPPLSPPTDSYRKRVRERNFRKQRERDITLHRKYGLFKGENSSDRYDAFSLPTARRDISNNIENIERGRRATSEIFQRRAPYVPGKRRAPLPPAITSSLPRNFSRKRPAPKPPNNFISNDIIKSHLNETMNSKVDSGSQPSSNTHIDLDNKTEKSVKQEKSKTEKSFLKQIFDNRKRNSSIETNYVKLLPNISELDEQAAKIIENKKLKLLESNAQITSNIDIKSETSVEKWTCPTCFKKYNTAMSCCLYCRSNRNQLDDSSKTNTKNVATNIYTQTDNTDLAKVASTSKYSEYDEKKKLKEMLKEMKDSLPKRPKQYVTETPTLRIGSSSATVQKSMLKSEANFENKGNKFVKSLDGAKQLNLDKGSMGLERTTGTSITTNDYLQVSSNGLSTNFPSNIISTSHESKIRLEKDFKDKECINNCQNLISNYPQKTTGPSTSKEFFMQSQSKDLIQNQIKKFNEEESNKIQVAQDSKLQNNNIEPFIKSKLSELSAAMLVQPLPAKADVHSKPKTVLTQSENSSNDKSVANAKTKKAEENINNLPPSNSIPSNLQEEDLLCNKTEINKKLNITNNISSTVESKLHTPLRISSLLNPVYNPIHSNCTTKNTLENVTETSTNISHKLNEPSTSIVMSQTHPISSSNQNPNKSNNEISVNKEKESSNKKYSTNTSVCKVLGVTPTSSKYQDKKVLDKIDHHSRRRELVNQLEKSIAKGDEQAAADAAIKLAKLRLSCSVLSFSSQIIGNTAEKTTIEAPAVKTSGDETKTVTKSSFLVMPIQEKVDSKLILQDSNLNKYNEKVNQSSSSPSKGKIIECNDIKSKRMISVNNVKNESVILKDSDENKMMSVQIWVEDKDATRGPISIPIKRKATMGELRQQAETSLGLDSRLQRWIVGRTLCSDDATPLVTLAGPELNSPFYLCVVETESKNESNNQILEKQNRTVPNKIQEAGEVYTELMKLEQQAIVPNADAFVCEVCMDECESGKGAVLRECLHSFCRECLSDVVRHCEEPVVSCPTMACPGLFQDREIRAILSTEDYERWLARGLATAECGTRNAFHCRTRDCSGWAFCEPGVRKFPCPVCKCNNCVPCQAIHEGETCERYQLKLRTAVTAAQTNETDESTQALLNSLIRRGEALTCPECHAIITKKWGCDWVKCSACKTEICWVTRGRRWGPGGRGDTSAGCKCGVDGKRCHPSCGYCH